jgi:hypothetical protein
MNTSTGPTEPGAAKPGRAAGLVPPADPAAYRGAPDAVGFLLTCALLTVVAGCIHVFLPDGGAGVIAGLNLGANGARTVALFAWAGATQIVWGLLLAVIALRQRPLVPLALALLLLERLLHAANFWLLHESSGARPPEHYVTLLLLPLLALFLWRSLARRSAADLPRRSAADLPRR